MKLTTKQLEKKKNLLDFYLTNQKGKTRKQISKHWQTYRSKKYTIEKLPLHRKRLAKIKQPEKRQQLSEQYHEKKYIKTAKLLYGSLQFQKKVKFTYSQQDHYKFKSFIDLKNLDKVKELNLEKSIGKLFSDKKKNIRYILVTLKIRVHGINEIIYLSDSFNPDRFYDLIWNNEIIIGKVLEKLSALKNYQGAIIGIYIRTVYDITQ